METSRAESRIVDGELKIFPDRRRRLYAARICIDSLRFIDRGLRRQIRFALQTAIDYRRRGFSVIPIKPRDKRPLISWEPK